MNAITLIRPLALGMMTFAELYAAWTEAERERNAADAILRTCPGDTVEGARFDRAEDRLEAIRREVHARLQSHVGLVPLAQIVGML